MDPDSSKIWASDVSIHYYGYIEYIAARLAPSPFVVKDITHEVIVEFLIHHERWDQQRDPKPILAKITRVVAAKHWKDRSALRSGAVERIASMVLQRSQEKLEEEQRQENIGRVHKCLDKLPEKERELIELRYFQHLSFPEIAQRIERKPNAVYQAVFRIREMLKKCLDGKNESHKNEQ